jgi:hypothetical protein
MIKKQKTSCGLQLELGYVYSLLLMVVLLHCVFKSLPLHGNDLCLMSYVIQICYMLYTILLYVLECGYTFLKSIVFYWLVLC